MRGEPRMNGTQREDGTMGYARSMSVAGGWRAVLLGLLVLISSFAWLAGASRWTAAEALVAAPDRVLAPENAGAVVASGSNDQGQTTVPAGLLNARAVAAGMAHSLALKSDGSVAAWGDNSYRQTNVPYGLGGDPRLSNAVAIAAGNFHSLALKSDGTVVAWGSNVLKQRDVPLGLGGVTDIAAGGAHSLARKGDGSVVGWGDNSRGQTTVPGGVMAIAAGYEHSLAIVDTTAPAAVDYFGADAAEGRVSLSWSNPSTPDFHSVRVLRSTTGPATSPQPDASQVKVYEGTAESFTDTGLANGTTYYYTIYARDDAGNFSPRAREMATPVDKTAPSVVATTPAGKNVARTANVTATFSEAMDEQSVEASHAVKLVKKGTTTPVAAVVTYDPTTKRATLNPERSLVKGATYSATVTTGATDLAGNPLAANKAWSFAVRR